MVWGGPCLHPAGEPPCLQVSDCGWVARRAPSLRSLYSLCRNMHAWLRHDPGNVCVVHCMVSGPASPGTQDRGDLQAPGIFCFLFAYDLRPQDSLTV